MRKLKLFCAVTVVLVCMFSFSISASAAAIEGVVDDRGVVQFPMDYVSDSSKQYYGIILKNSSDKYYLFSFGLPSDLASGTTVTFSLQKRNSNNLDFLLPHIYKDGYVTSGNYKNLGSVPIHYLSNGNFYTNTSALVYDKSSSPINSYTPSYIRQGLSDYGTIVDYQIVYFPNSNILFNSLNVTDIDGGSYPYTALPITHEGFYYEFTDGITNFSGTDLDQLLTSDGTLTPVYDNNGNIINYTIHNEFDTSVFTQGGDAPDPYDSSGIDDYNSEQAATDEAIDSFKGDYDFSDVFSDFDITDFNDAMSFWEDRFDDIVGTNPIFLVVIVSMLTLGIIVVILNRKVGT